MGETSEPAADGAYPILDSVSICEARGASIEVVTSPTAAVLGLLLSSAMVLVEEPVSGFRVTPTDLQRDTANDIVAAGCSC